MLNHFDHLDQHIRSCVTFSLYKFWRVRRHNSINNNDDDDDNNNDNNNNNCNNNDNNGDGYKTFGETACKETKYSLYLIQQCF